MYIKSVIKGESYVCPVCKKVFKATDDTKYIAQGGYTCSWQCFLDPVKHPEKYKGDTTKSNDKDVTANIVDNAKKIDYTVDINSKVDLFLVEEPIKKRVSKKKSK